MINSFSLIRRRPDLSPEQFRAHWLDPHGPLTAKLPGTRRYVQNHVVAGPGTNTLAQGLEIDGFAVLAFDTPEGRAAAHASPAMAACNVDSRSFIGAVSRMITDDRGVPLPIGPAPWKQIVVTLAGSTAPPLGDLLRRLQLSHAVEQHITEQAGAPNSTVPHHGVDLAGMVEVWVSNEAALARNAAVLAEAEAVVFQVQPVIFL